MTAPLHLWLRAETKPNEQRTALTPDAAKVLMEHGIQVTLEASEVSAYKPSEYPSGVTLVPPGSWVSEAPKDALIYGLKELPDSTEPLMHRHIMFGHCFKGQI